METKIIIAHAECMLALMNLTPIEALNVLENLRNGLIKSHNIDRSYCQIISE